MLSCGDSTYRRKIQSLLTYKLQHIFYNTMVILSNFNFTMLIQFVVMFAHVMNNI
uniref:Uncharacterized protein n=1 Tax=Arundo donax TaxID=35708 RepID=A0A0A8Z1U8_ARUDO